MFSHLMSTVNMLRDVCLGQHTVTACRPGMPGQGKGQHGHREAGPVGRH
jgi:hypothetical protein